MPKTKEQQAQEAIDSANESLEKIKGTATKTPKRKGKKKPQTKGSVTSQSRTAASRKRASKATTPTSTATTPIQAPVVDAELVHAPVSGAGISAQVRGDIAQTTPEAMAQNLVAIQQQQNSVLVSQANHKLDKQVAIDQGLQLAVELQQQKNATVAESVATQAMKTSQQAAKTSIEGVKLQGLNIDLEGEAALLPHRRESWDIKATEQAIDNEGARALLPLRKQHWTAKLQLAEVGLQKLNIQIEQARSELYAPLEISQLSDSD